VDIKFTWDENKYELNFGRHRVSFEEAIEAFFDQFVVEDFDRTHSDEEPRYNLTGLSSRRLLFIVFTEPEPNVIRIISARKAEKKHQNIYAQNKFR
jgi:uncharacterized protein